MYPVEERVAELLVDPFSDNCCCKEVVVLTAVAAERIVGGFERGAGDLPPWRGSDRKEILPVCCF